MEQTTVKKETAVEWYAEQGMKLEIQRLKGEISTEKMLNLLFEKVRQAKAMEKEMMNKNIKFICHGCGTKHTGENDDQMYEVCKQCFTNL